MCTVQAMVWCTTTGAKKIIFSLAAVALTTTAISFASYHLAQNKPWRSNREPRTG